NFVAVYSDITSIKENEERLEELAHFDQLTGLPNRLLFHDRLRSSMARARRQKSYLVVMYVDLDGFKAVNDTLGHEAGDQLLVRAATHLRASIRDDDTAARLGGDEFALLFNGLSSTEHVRMLAQRVIENLTLTVETEAEPLAVTASVGVALYVGDSSSEEQLLERADQAMYQAKRQGKQRYCLSKACFKHETEQALSG
ncbi:MAG TPA: GGDEF domain-containing protein, partial [Candidatus Tenderia sp.]|nr:GGDEF domain-containing protein [Candidatus Tenderia sp.]